MANVTSVQILEDGPRNIVAKVQLSLDTFALTATTVLDPATAYNDPLYTTTQFRIDRLDWSLQDGLAITLQWDATTPVSAWTMYGREDMDWGKSVGGLQNNAGTGKTGKIVMISNSPTAGTYVGSFLIRAVKQ